MKHRARWLDLTCLHLCLVRDTQIDTYTHTHTHCRLIVHQSNCIQLSSVSVNESAIGTCHFCQVVMRWCAAAYFTCWSGLPVDVKVFSLPSFLPFISFWILFVPTPSSFHSRDIIFAIFYSFLLPTVYLCVLPSETFILWLYLPKHNCIFEIDDDGDV